METLKYELVEREFYCEESVYIGYGVAYGSDIAIQDVSIDRKFMENLVDLFNESDLAPEHLKDVLEDLIG